MAGDPSNNRHPPYSPRRCRRARGPRCKALTSGLIQACVFLAVLFCDGGDCSGYRSNDCGGECCGDCGGEAMATSYTNSDELD